MNESRIPTQGFTPADHELWEQIDGAGEISETIMRHVGGFGIDSQTVTREIIFAIAQLEQRFSREENATSS